MKSFRLLAVVVASLSLWGCPSSDKTANLDEDLAVQDVMDTSTQDAPAALDALDATDTGKEIDEDTGNVGPCKEGDIRCINGKLATCDTSLGWLLENCPEGTVCEEGACISNSCEPLSTQCAEGGVQVCSPSGSGWSDPLPCADGQVCQGGLCVPETCEPGTKECVDNKAISCDPEGATVIVQCVEGEVCFAGECIECTKDADCGEGLACVEGECTAPALELSPEALPDGKVNQPYTAQFEAKGGVPPYIFSFGVQGLPGGLSTDAMLGVLQGTPVEAGVFELDVEVVDGEGTVLERTYSFEVFPPEVEVVITTGSPLPQGEEGTPYSVTLQATGGTEPYSWGIVGGALPDGLTLSSSGVISGTPAAHGPFNLKVKVFDNAEPVHVASKDFDLNLKIAPLEIVGSQQYDLFVAKIIVLPLLTAVQGIPLPYSAQLEAKGGVKPYHWAEQPLPSYVGFLIPNGGIPQGLNLSDTGKLSGSVTDPSQAISVNIPFVNINVTGFFFMGEVNDSQDPADSASAIYLIPTVPVSF